VSDITDRQAGGARQAAAGQVALLPRPRRPFELVGLMQRLRDVHGQRMLGVKTAC